MINYFEEEVALKRAQLKKDIKITAGKCTKILLTLGIITQVLAIIAVLIIKMNENITINVSKELIDFLTSYLPCILGDIIAIILGMKITKVKIKSDMFCKNQSSVKFISLGAISCIGVGIISSIIYAIYSSIIEYYGIVIPSPDFNFPTNNPFILTLILGYVCILGPIFEEIIFRGFILKSMQRYGNLTAIIVTSILFSMFHLNLVQFVPPVLIGLILGIITVKSKSIVPSIIAHIFNNTVTFAMSSIVQASIVVQTIVTMIYFSLGILGLVFFVKIYRKEITKIVKDNSRLLKTRQKVLISFTGGWSIAYIIFYLIMIFGMFFLMNHSLH